jgi:N-acetyl-gamma-glutamyl-phosphate reductase
MKKVGIVGATGYAGIELVRMLLAHPNVGIAGITSTSFKGKKIQEVYPHLDRCINMQCEDFESIADNCDIIFAALPHGLSEDIAFECNKKGLIFIDLGADFRLDDEKDYKEWYKLDYKYKDLHKNSTYGLCELNREKIKSSKVIGNPGCYPTSVILALAPLLKNKLINTKSIIIDSKSGVSGAGRGLDLGTHYTECNESIKAYKIAAHRHIPEIEQELSKLADEKIFISFTPHLVPMNRGMLSTIYCDLSQAACEKLDANNVAESLNKLYKDFYASEKFVRVLDEGKNPESKNVCTSNFCDIGINYDKRTNRIILVSAIDNMIKGAAGQAIQNMNIICGFEEDAGLRFFPISL